MTDLPEELMFDVPYLGAEEVIDEVLALLARLENDRRGARVNLEKETGRIKMLQGRIDQLAMTRMAEFPDAVQRGREFSFVSAPIFLFKSFAGNFYFYYGVKDGR